MGRIFLLFSNRNIFHKIVIFEGLQKGKKKEEVSYRFCCFDAKKENVASCKLELTVKSSLGIEQSGIGYFQNFPNDLMKAWLYHVCRYSMGIRQKVAEEFGSSPNKEGKLGKQHAADVIVTPLRSENYHEDLASSVFCGVMPGDGWSGRMEDSILQGCIPVIIQVHCT